MNILIKCLMLLLLPVTAAGAQLVMPNDVIINEILFNPSKDGFDYVEGINRSTGAVYLNELAIANKNGADEIANVRIISKDLLRLDPGALFILTANEKWLRQNYWVPASVIIVQLTSMPSFPDDEGVVLLLRKSDSLVIDEVRYSEDWHFRMIDDAQGVALERINFELASQDKNNWTSASSSSGYGTPGSINSQYRPNDTGTAVMSVLPKMFSPNNDGYDDYATISIHLNERGSLANAVIYDVTGRRIRYLLKNELLGTTNRFIWDGYDDYGKLLPSGIYIVMTQIFNMEGMVRKFRSCIVLNSFPP
ncbi:MAG TPA: hypothetical protein VM101_14655 [Flavitalea sp.]|nr:hypothetical protein [Flavitalea sp.]